MTIFPEDLPEAKKPAMPELISRVFDESGNGFTETYLTPVGDIVTTRGRVEDGQVMYDLTDAHKFATDLGNSAVGHLEKLYALPEEGKE